MNETQYPLLLRIIMWKVLSVLRPKRYVVHPRLFQYGVEVASYDVWGPHSMTSWTRSLSVLAETRVGWCECVETSQARILCYPGSAAQVLHLIYQYPYRPPTDNTELNQLLQNATDLLKNSKPVPGLDMDGKRQWKRIVP